jgi:hypothetical protein
VTEKLRTYWRVWSLPDGTMAPWERLDGPPVTQDELCGDLKIENDDQIAMVYAVDQAALDLVTQKSRDVAALVREHEIPHKPARP